MFPEKMKKTQTLKAMDNLPSLVSFCPEKTKQAE